MALGKMVYMNADDVTNRLLIKQPRFQGSLSCFEKEPWLQLFMWLWQWTPQQSRVNVLSFSLVDGATEYEVRFEAVTCIQAHAICFEKVNKGATILDKIKWNSKPPSPPNQGWSRAKGKNEPFSHPWFRGGGGEGGLGFPFILSKIVGLFIIVLSRQIFVTIALKFRIRRPAWFSTCFV